ncbi:hypothetical protein K8R04_01190 [Candidatus Uhrbacteria bacterium]|nr:hypothetical protein [Candidatus Uhrbacteria bacterium]
MRVLLGLVIVAVGAFFVIRTRTIVDFFGGVDFAEKYLGGGGTNLFYKLLGIVFCLLGFLIATNMWTAFLQATLGSLFPAAQPK